MRFLRSFCRCLAPLVLAWALAGCPQRPEPTLTAETEDAQYRRGKEFLQAGRNQEALTSFLNVVDKRSGDAPESHLELGELYLVHVKDPIAAIYHYRKYRELKPSSPQSELVRQRIETATREFARSLPAQPLEGQVERLEMLEQLAALRRENELLRREAESRTLPVVPRDPQPTVRETPMVAAGDTGLRQRSPETQTRPQGTGARRYTVQRGDTLFRIAETVYGPGQGSRWREILAANRATLPRENALKPGMELTIP